MITKAQKIRLGIFISAALIIFLAAIAALSLERFFQEKDVYHISYKDVSLTGLDAGSSVKYLGLNVGTVTSIAIDPEDISRIIVTIAVKQGTPVKNDLEAEISTIGITGIKVIELRGGTNEADLLEPGSYIKAGKSLTEQITGKAEVIGEKVELLLNNLIELSKSENRKKFTALMDRTSSIAENLDILLKENNRKINSSIANLDKTLQHLAGAGASSEAAISSVESFIQSDSLRTTLNDIAQIADKLNKANIYNLDEQLNVAVDRLNHMLTQMDLFLTLNLNKFNQSIEGLNETISHLNSAARQIDEDPSVLIGGSKPKDPPDEELEQ